jgi:predicted RNase H-like HicB family nuclease
VAHEVIHLYVQKTEDGYYATSPQVPGLMYGRATLEELRDDLEGALEFYFDHPGPFRVMEHR